MARKDIPVKYTGVYYDEKTDTYLYKLAYIDILGIKKYETRRGFKVSPKEAYEAKVARKKELEGVSNNTFCYMTIEQLYEEFITAKKLKLKKSSLRVFTKTLSNNVLPFFKNKIVDKINITDITKWQNYILNLNYKHSYNKTIYTCFNQLLNFGVEHCNIKINVLSKIGTFKNDQIIAKKFNIWAVEDFSKFIAVVEEIDWKAFYTLLFLTGLRRGEAQALTWNDIDFINNEIIVNKTFNGKDEKGNLIITTLKLKILIGLFLCLYN